MLPALRRRLAAFLLAACEADWPVPAHQDGTFLSYEFETEGVMLAVTVEVRVASYNIDFTRTTVTSTRAASFTAYVLGEVFASVTRLLTRG